jgi:DNA replication protein DnaC
MSTIAGQFARLAEVASRKGQFHAGYIEVLLVAEMEEHRSRAITRLLHEARLPQMKTLEAFRVELLWRLSRATARVDPGRLRGFVA